MIHLLKVAIPPSLADLFVSLAHSGTVSSASRICIMPKNSTNRHRTIQSAPLGQPGDWSRTALSNLHIAQGVVRISAAVHSSDSVQLTADLTVARLGRRCRLQLCTAPPISETSFTSESRSACTSVHRDRLALCPAQRGSKSDLPAFSAGIDKCRTSAR